MREAVAEYKMAVKKVDPNFDGDYYDNLIFGELLTPTPKTLLTSNNLTQLAHPGPQPSKKPRPSPSPKQMPLPSSNKRKPLTSRPPNKFRRLPTNLLFLQQAFRIFLFFYFLTSTFQRKFPLWGCKLYFLKTILGPGWPGPFLFVFELLFFFECMCFSLFYALYSFLLYCLVFPFSFPCRYMQFNSASWDSCLSTLSLQLG